MRAQYLKASLFFAVTALAISAQAQQDSTTAGIEAYREALQDGNPADLFVDSGAEIWKKKAGPKNASLEKCDLGLGPGKVTGAYAQLPRYFKDTNKVQDLESRLLTCMEKIQGVDTSDIVKASFTSPKKGELVALSAYISNESKGMKVNVSLKHPKEKQMYDLGRRLFYYEGGQFDFACATCHGQEGKRIRLQDLPYIPSAEGAAKGWTTWPAYRVSAGQMWSMQWRINDCFRQQRFPEPIYASDVTIAISSFMAGNSNGATMQTPGIKR
jgi:L-cysteine S-thiosulfotransferase